FRDHALGGGRMMNLAPVRRHGLFSGIARQAPIHGKLELHLATILITLTAFPAILKPFTTFATIFKALTALLALTAHETLAESAAIAALVETGTIPAIEIKAQRGFFDRVKLFGHQSEVGRSSQRECGSTIRYQRRSRQNGHCRCAGQKQTMHVVLLGCAR